MAEEITKLKAQIKKANAAATQQTKATPHIQIRTHLMTFLQELKVRDGAIASLRQQVEAKAILQNERLAPYRLLLVLNELIQRCH